MKHTYCRENMSRTRKITWMIAVVMAVAFALTLATTQYSYAYVDPDRMLSIDDTMVPGEELYIDSGLYFDYEYEEYDPDTQGMVSHLFYLRKINVKSETPIAEGKKVISTRKGYECIEVKAHNYGQAVLEAVGENENGKTVAFEYTVNVTQSKYRVDIYSPKEYMYSYNDYFLPGDNVPVNAHVRHDTAKGKGTGTLDDLTYEWKVTRYPETGGDREEADYLCEIEGEPNSPNANIRLKTKPEILAALEELGNPEKRWTGRIYIELTVKRDDQEVAKTEASVTIVKEYYEICKPEEKDIFFDPSDKVRTIDLKLYRYTAGDNGEKEEYIYPDDEVEFSISTDYEHSSTKLKLTGKKLYVEFNDKNSDSDVFRIDATIKGEDRFIYDDFSVRFIPFNINNYSIDEIGFIPVDNIDDKVYAEDLGIKIHYNGWRYLDPDEYTLTFKREYYDEKKKKTMYETATSPLGIHENDLAQGATDYVVTAKAKPGTGYTGSTTSSFTLWSRNVIGKWSRLWIDEEEIEDERGGDGMHIWDNYYPDYGYGRYPMGVGENMVVSQADEGELNMGEDFKVEYFVRKLKVPNPENYNLQQLDEFPTKPGTYLAKATGIGGYTGTAYFAFDITEPLVSAEVTGIVDKTYTGKDIGQSPKVVLEGKELKEGIDYELSYHDNRNVGKATAQINGINKYSGAIRKDFNIRIANNPVVVKGKTVKIKASKVKKKNQTIKVGKAFKITNKKTKLTFKKTKGSGKIIVSKTGKVTVKKGLKKGTYKVNVKVTAAATSNYKGATKYATMKIKVR